MKRSERSSSRFTSVERYPLWSACIAGALGFASGNRQRGSVAVLVLGGLLGAALSEAWNDGSGASTRPRPRNAETAPESRTETNGRRCSAGCSRDLWRVIRLEIQLSGGQDCSVADLDGRSAIAALVLLFAGAIAGSCLLAALILLLHKTVKWWESFAVGGAVASSCGFVAYSVIKRLRRQSLKNEDCCVRRCVPRVELVPGRINGVSSSRANFVPCPC